MMAAQLKEATMDPKKRTLLRVVLLEDEKKNTEKSVDRLMGTKPKRALPSFSSAPDSPTGRRRLLSVLFPFITAR
jgi:DNA gyrase/topoisomerase IV subunit B